MKTIAPRIEDEILSSASDEERIAVVEAFIECRMNKNVIPQLPVFKALKEIIHGHVSMKVRDLSSEYFLSEPQFERQFLRFTGI